MVRHIELKGLYEIEKTIGCGGFAKVKLATHLATGEKVAIKIMDKAALGDDLSRVTLEIKALKNLAHQHICKLFEVMDTETHIFIVIEYCSGGELFDHIVEKNRLSEAESRTFFRQIVSAVAYLHSLGYIHRDLKPENVLLDQDQNLKLIDFGLCARPEGGVTSPLYTSCGSPTYAAPELVLGQKYLGPEVDVWAMGVLLYALLAGSLPFDDVNVDSLYKKILTGKYAEPSCLSEESRRLIRDMLQIDPKKRVTVKELLSHPWLTLGYLDPVDFKPENSKIYHQGCVEEIANHFNVNPERLWRHLRKWKYDYFTSTYLILLAKKRRRSSIRLLPTPAYAQLKLYLAKFLNETIPYNPNPLTEIQVADSRLTHLYSPTYPVSRELRRPIVRCANRENECKKNTISMPNPPISNGTPNEESGGGDIGVSSEVACIKLNRAFLEPRRPSGIRRPQKRIRSPTLDGECSPIPSKKASILASTGKSTPKTPEGKKTMSSSDTPGPARRVLGSIERSLHKVRHVLTPKKAVEAATQPVLLNTKVLFNVSTTQSSDPEFIINELTSAFQSKGFLCNRKGFTLRGKVEPNAVHSCSGCSFELEVCFLPPMGQQNNQCCITPTKSILKNGTQSYNTPTASQTFTPPTPMAPCKKQEKGFSCVGIRRKRLKGDSWCYKKVCEEILAVTVKDFRAVTESAV